MPHSQSGEKFENGMVPMINIVVDPTTYLGFKKILLSVKVVGPNLKNVACIY